MFFGKIDENYTKLSEKINLIFPHIENISILFANENGLNHFENGEYIEVSELINSKISSYRNTNLNYQWILPSELLDFYVKDNTKIHQLDLLSEHENRLLLLSYKSQIDGVNDLVCLTFPREITFLGLYKTVKNLSTDDKILIGELLYKIIDVEIQIEKNNFIKQKRISEYLKLKDNSQNHLLSTNYYNFIVLELKNNVECLIKKNISFNFSNELIDYVISSKYSILEVSNILTESFETIQFIEQIDSFFTFELFHFKLIESERNYNKPSFISINNKNDKIIDLLDRLELAAKQIESNGIVINGKTIAQYLIPPVSPPAITDMLKKNINKIENRLNEYPKKWMLIRRFLKPLRELEFKTQISNSRKIG